MDLNNENINLNKIACEDICANTKELEDIENEEEDDEDEDGWITPYNLKEIQKESLVEADKYEINDLKIKVGCMTSDFSMQVFDSRLSGSTILIK